jgi:hypothetical protein
MMHIDNFILLQQEGHLMQGAFKSCFQTLRRTDNITQASLYSASFTYSIGIERLLKIILLMDSWQRERKFLDNETLRKQGHHLDTLYANARLLAQHYGLQWEAKYEPDQISADLLTFLSDFANGNRYYNLNALAGISKTEDPIKKLERLLYRIFKADHKEGKDASFQKMLRHLHGPDQDPLLHNVVLAGSASHLSWRLIKLLVLLRDLLLALREQIHEADFALQGPNANADVPFMEEFLDFVCEDKDIILTGEDWPD